MRHGFSPLRPAHRIREEVRGRSATAPTPLDESRQERVAEPGGEKKSLERTLVRDVAQVVVDTLNGYRTPSFPNAFTPFLSWRSLR